MKLGTEILVKLTPLYDYAALGYIVFSSGILSFGICDSAVIGLSQYFVLWDL